MPPAAAHEHVADQAVHSAVAARQRAGEAEPAPDVDLTPMAECAMAMLDQAVSALATRDAVAARRVCHMRERLDASKGQICRELLGLMLAEPAAADRAARLLRISRCLERAADHAGEIARRVLEANLGDARDTAA
jgi:phosphate transport system protein